MKLRVIAAMLLLAVSVSFAACSDEGGEAKSTEKVTESAPAGTADSAEGTFGDLHAIVDGVKEYYGDTVEFIFTEDEYSDEVLMYTYGLMDDKFVNAVESYVLTECDGMSADTFAIVTFKSGTDKAIVKEAADIMETEYVESLKSKLAAYNPEEFAASDGYKLSVYDDAVMMVISADNTDAIISAIGK